MAVDGALRERRRGPAPEEVLREDALEVGAKSNGFCAIQTGSLACSLKMTSGQPLPVRFHSWIFVCIVVAPLPSPSKVTIFTFTFGCVFGVELRHRQADGVDPDGERAGGPDRARCAARRCREQRRGGRRTRAARAKTPDGRSSCELLCCRAACHDQRRTRGARGRNPAGRSRLGRCLDKTVAPDARLAGRRVGRDERLVVVQFGIAMQRCTAGSVGPCTSARSRNESARCAIRIAPVIPPRWFALVRT